MNTIKTNIKHIINTAVFLIGYLFLGTVAHADNGEHPCEHKGWQAVSIINYSTEDAIFVSLQFPYTFAKGGEDKSNQLMLEYYDFNNKNVKNGIDAVAKHFEAYREKTETPPSLLASIQLEKKLVDENTYDEGDVTPKKIKACVLTDIKDIRQAKTAEKTDKLSATKTHYQNADVAFVKKGKLYFYDTKTHKIMPFNQEREPVFTVVFDDHADTIYYTVKRDGVLWLKKASHLDTAVKISELANAKVKIEEFIPEMSDDTKSPLVLRNKKLFLPYHFSFENMPSFSKMLVYSLKDKTLQSKPIDYTAMYGATFYNDAEKKPYKVVNHDLIYRGNNLTQDLKLMPPSEELKKMLGPETDYFYGFKLSKDKSKAIFWLTQAFGDLPHGPLLIADVSGDNQKRLSDDGLTSQIPPKWIGNRLVFLQINLSDDFVAAHENDKDYQDDEGNSLFSNLGITDDKDNSIQVIAKGVDYFTARKTHKKRNAASTKAKQKTRAQHSRAKGNTGGRSAFGITVTRCQFEFDKEDFCGDERMQTFAEVMAKRQPNFDNDKLLYIFKGQAGTIISDAEREMYRVVVMDKKAKTVVPLRHALGHAYDESGTKRFAVNDKGETLEYRFDSHSNTLCFVGNIYAYRDSFSYDADAVKKFCFVYDGKTFEKDGLGEKID